jgi:hypothetical protein
MRCPRWFYAVPAVVAGVLAACGEPLGLPPAGVNVVDTVALYALDGTPITTPSGYNLIAQTPHTVRTDRSPDLDFAFNIDSTDQAVLLPTGALGLGQGSGIQVTTTPFDSIKSPPGGTYELAKPVPVSVGTIAVLHSRLTTCSYLTVGVFLYAKIEVLAIDAAERRMTFRILADANCGYRSLEPGAPQR